MMRVIEPIERDSLCWRALEWESRSLVFASPYGDPELALTSHEEIAVRLPEWEPEQEDKDLMTSLLGLLCAEDRIVMTLWNQGLSQAQIGSHVGRTQPSICNKLRSIRGWVDLVYPLRRAHEREPQRLPESWDVHPQRRHWWTTITSTHLPQNTVSRMGGYDVRVGQAALPDILEQGSESQRAIASLLMGARSYLWTRPRSLSTPKGM